MYGYDDWDWCGTRFPGWPIPGPQPHWSILTNPALLNGGLTKPVVPTLPGQTRTF